MTNPSPPSKIRRFLVPAVIGGLVVLGGTACDVGDGSAEHPARADLDDTWKCVGDADTVRAVGSVTNHSSGESTYFLTISFGEDDAASATVEDVGAGETRVVEAVTHDLEGPADDCDVTDVERFSA